MLAEDARLLRYDPLFRAGLGKLGVFEMDAEAAAAETSPVLVKRSLRGVVAGVRWPLAGSPGAERAETVSPACFSDSVRGRAEARGPASIPAPRTSVAAVSLICLRRWSSSWSLSRSEMAALRSKLWRQSSSAIPLPKLTSPSGIDLDAPMPIPSPPAAKGPVSSAAHDWSPIAGDRSAAAAWLSVRDVLLPEGVTDASAVSC